MGTEAELCVSRGKIGVAFYLPGYSETRVSARKILLG